MATKVRGRVRREDEHKIQTNYVFLLETFDPTLDGTLDEIYSRGVFDDHDKDKVENGGENTARGRADRFLQLLLNSGQDAYQAFLDALKERGNEHIAKKLEATDMSKFNKEGPLAWIDKLPEDKKQRPPSDADASRLSVALGSGWQSLFNELGMSQVKIQHAEMSNIHNPGGAITNLIIKWRQQHARNAHFIELLKAMVAVDNDRRCSIDWAIVEKVVKGDK